MTARREMNDSITDLESSQLSSYEKYSNRAIAKDKDVALLLEKNYTLVAKNRDMKLELKQVKKAHRTVMNNLKAVAFKEAVSYLMIKSTIVIEMLTRTHHRFIK